jgi:hypothetical protein
VVGPLGAIDLGLTLERLGFASSSAAARFRS